MQLRDLGSALSFQNGFWGQAQANSAFDAS